MNPEHKGAYFKIFSLGKGGLESLRENDKVAVGERGLAKIIGNGG